MPKVQGNESAWYKAERNTADLIQAVLSHRELSQLSGEEIWQLLRLAWITKSKQKDHLSRAE